MDHESVTTIYFSGGLDIARYPELHGYFEACPPAAARVLVDLSSVKFVDSTFLTELLMFSKRCQRSHKPLAVVAGGNIARIITISGLDKRLHVVPTREAAMKFFSTLAEPATQPSVITEEVPAEKTRGQA